MYNTTCLDSIFICGCDSLTYIAKGHLPPTLRRLTIEYCKNIRTVLLEEDGINSTTSLLEDLHIGFCTSLESVTSSGELPATLKHLFICGCKTLESMAESFPHNSFLEFISITHCGNLKSLPRGIHGLSNLHKLVIESCPNLDPFPDGERELLPPNLRWLMIDEACEKMVHGIHNLASLQYLKISSIVSFPEEGFPTNITELVIKYLNITEALFEWGLHRLTSLRRLEIEGGCPHLVSFPTPKMMLPASLTSLRISSFPNLESLSSDGFRGLVSLEHLDVAECEKLTSFPMNDLPPSLLILQISKCPLLEERYKRDQGREWTKIAQIPCVEIDDRLTYREVYLGK
ncbi:hypothetical protein CJ030_MR8G025476 [Morella rubra]|uniref:Uncharacterized protein n=1 Tax=Morella rubra TaxID=262757 RepID=A0A6A1UTI5_9ROSI|nr:hypothetical protein CJ030_MR8G025476 [Morella rubra]